MSMWCYTLGPEHLSWTWTRKVRVGHTTVRGKGKTEDLG